MRKSNARSWKVSQRAQLQLCRLLNAHITSLDHKDHDKGCKEICFCFLQLGNISNRGRIAYSSLLKVRILVVGDVLPQRISQGFLSPHHAKRYSREHDTNHCALH